MSVIPEQFHLRLMPSAHPDSIVTFGNARFTLLTDRLIRLEYHPQAHFEDRATQAFWYREQPVPEFKVTKDGLCLEIETDYLLLRYKEVSGMGFTPDTLSISVKATSSVWHPGDADAMNLRGTTRTLDFINGYTTLEPGLMSRSGWSVLDDSKSLVLNDESWLEPREPDGTDLYFFGYGHDYKACLRDYCAVSGQIPMIPRWALGNWWSRYWAYTQDDLVKLLRDFEAYDLPFSVCIVDMDWHVTQTGNASTGWTGYTWNRDLFPDPKAFIDFAHERGLKISLNLHPAEGIHDHEEQYEMMARTMGIDPATRQPVTFDITNPVFANAYFEVLHRPHENMGVDFWWIDWQQGQKSALDGLDPLWLINHLHFYDQGRDGVRRPFIFSRWGTEGHQRYPIGFSGDSYVTWDTLGFESYMTAAASNIAYGWWSHDIGGHTSGVEDPELLTRWVQFGVFSPINRLHATKGLFYDRRPWGIEDAEVLRVLRDALQLRHAFIPYIYTMARRAHDDSLPLIQPMYYEYPEAEAAYHCPQQYLFGTQLIAAPFVTPADPETGLSRQVVWLPEGDWIHFSTGEHFAGDSWHAVYGRLEDIPLFAHAGAIIPLAPKGGWHSVDNPDELHVHLFAGADNTFTLYEDDGETTAYLENHFATTTIRQQWLGDQLTITIEPPKGDVSFVPSQRWFYLHLHGVSDRVTVEAQIDGSPVSATAEYNAKTETLAISGIEVRSTAALTISIRKAGDNLLAARDRKAETVLRLLKFARLNTGVRNHIALNLDAITADPTKIAPYLLAMTESQGRAFFETLYGAGVHHVPDTQEPTLLVMWNNHENPHITYRYSDIYLFFGSIPSMNHTNGIVPRFTHVIPPAKSWSHGAQGQHVHRTQWQLQIDYLNLLTVIEQHREDSP